MLTKEQRLRMLQCPQRPVDLVLDTDTYNEIDDQFAWPMPCLQRKN